jgi:hypothetical protein
MNNWCICWFSRIFLLGILTFKGLTARRLYKSFGVKGLTVTVQRHTTYSERYGTLLTVNFRISSH